MTHRFSAHLLGSTGEPGPSVPDAEHVAVGAVLYVMEDAVLLALPVLTAAGLKLLQGANGRAVKGLRFDRNH